jgi:hypothetical protein
MIDFKGLRVEREIILTWVDGLLLGEPAAGIALAPLIEGCVEFDIVGFSPDVAAIAGRKSQYHR